MMKPLTRAGGVALAALVVLAFAGTQASADTIPLAHGWSASWQYTSATTLLVKDNVAGAALTATGTDNGSSSTYSVSLSDTSVGDGFCVSVDWKTPTTNTHRFVCDGQTTFVPPTDTPGVQITLCGQVALDPIQAHHCSIWSVSGSELLRAAGNGWSYNYDGTPDPYNMTAHLIWNYSELDFYVIDNYREPGDRAVYPTIHQTGGPSSNCGSGTLEMRPTDGVTISTGTACGSTQFTTMPMVELFAGPDDAQQCVWSSRSTGKLKPCVSMLLPVPN